MKKNKFQIGDLAFLSFKEVGVKTSISKNVVHVQRKTNGAFIVVETNRGKYTCVLCWFNEKTNHKHVAIGENIIYYIVDKFFTFEESELISKEVCGLKNLPVVVVDKILRAREKKVEKIKKKKKQIKELKSKRKPIIKEVPKNIQWALAHPYQGGSCSGK